jgi:hypothetical protein
MDKTIETKFFEAFSFGGVVANCIEWMRYTYNLPCVKTEASTKDVRKLNEKWVKYYEETLPKSILEATNAFNFDVIDCIDCPLMDEIEGNLNDCKTDTQKENYLFSLLLPFGNGLKGCGYARVFHPKTEIEPLERWIKEEEKDNEQWALDKDDEFAAKQVKAGYEIIDGYREQIDWALYVNRQFCEILNKTLNKTDKENSVEYCLHRFSRAAKMFADRLDALLLTYGIDLLRLQRECGVYLKEYRIITDVDLYIGSRELAQRYIDALPKDNAQEQPKTAPEGAVILPDVLNTDEAKKVFQKAIQAGLMSKEGTRYKWNDTKQLLAYFAEKMSDKFGMEKRLNNKGEKMTSWKPFENMFGIKGLKDAKQDWLKTNTKFTPTGYEKVDALF